MSAQEANGLISFIGVWVQLGGTWLLLTLFYLLARHAGTRPYFMRWVWAWFALLAGILSIIARYLVAPALLPPGTALSADMIRATQLSYQVAKCLHLGLLFSGTWQLCRGAPLPGRGGIRFAAMVLLAFVTAAGFVDMSPIMALQAAVAVPVYLGCAVLLARLPSERRSMGTRMTATVFVGLAVLWICYGIAFGHLALKPGASPLWLVSALPAVNSYVDTGASMLLAFGMVVILLEDARQDAEGARAEREQLQARLAQSLRMEALGRLVSGVAHELNNPLAAILTFSEQLLDEQGEGSSIARPLGTIREQARRARAIVRDLLSFVRRREERREPADISVLVDRTVRALEADLLRQAVTLVVDVEPNLPLLACDPPGIEQVLTNLIDNAARAAPAGTVVLRVRREREGVAIEVVDAGPGIPPQHLPRIFEPFFTTRGTGEGTGLGLSVSLGIVQQHGGELHAENRDPGPGARFVAWLPLGEETRQPVAGRPSGLQAGPARGAAGRALIIDDEEAVRASLRRYFERHGWRVDEAGDGAAGLAKLLASRDGPGYDLIVCDLRMPGLSGVEVHEWVRASCPELLRRMVFASGDTASPETAAFLTTSACPVLEKPFELSELASVVARVQARQAGAA
jgi:signal transduction histidine kinase/CheY-like chemotaxis protein